MILIVFFIPVGFALSLGPYTGQIIDSRTGEPIIGASILMYHMKTIPHPMGGTDVLANISLTRTDDNGVYSIPKTAVNLGLSAMLYSTRVIFYQPGYIISTDRVTYVHPIDSDKKPRDIKQAIKLVKLDRIPPDFDHKKHYKKIDRVLWGLREYEDFYAGLSPTEKPRKTGPILEVREFRRRTEWEERRAYNRGRK